MVKYNKTKKGGFFLFNINKNKNKNKNSKNKNKNNKNKNKNKKHVTLDGSECWEQHNIWQLQKRNNKCTFSFKTFCAFDLKLFSRPPNDLLEIILPKGINQGLLLSALKNPQHLDRLSLDAQFL